MSSSLMGNQGMRGAFSSRGAGPTGQMAQGQRGGTGNIGGFKQAQLQNFSPEQMQLFKQLFSHLSPESFTGRLATGEPGMFEEIEAPALKQFSELQGNLASRFSGMGAGARRSSGFQNTANQAASDFAGQLQSQRQGLQRQAIQDLLGMGGQLLGQQPFENVLVPKKKGFLESLFGGASEGVGGGLGGLLGKLFGL